MKEEQLFSEIDYLSSLDEYLAFMQEHFGLEPENVLLAIDYQKYCDYGCGYFLEFIGKNPDFNNVEFQEFVLRHNKADRDSGELADIAKFEIDRLAEEFAEENRIKTPIIKRKIESVTWEQVLEEKGLGGVWEEDLAKKKNPQDYPKGTFHYDHHARGKSVHIDLRIKVNDHLYGWTITDQVEGAIGEKIGSLPDFKKYPWNDSKIFKFQPDMGDKNIKVVAVKKFDQPLAWMNIRDVVIPAGSTGATKFEPGVFRAVDEGMAYQGTTKPYFHEWFLDGKYFKGRLIFRLIPVRKEWEKKPKARLQWQAWMASSDTKGQLPYLLSPRGRSRKDIAPPEGESWLPPEWEKKVKVEYRWWPDSKSKQEKIKLIDETYNDLIEKGEIKARKLKEPESIKKSMNTGTTGEGAEWIPEGYGKVKIHKVKLSEIRELKKARFLLRRLSWRGQFVVRGMSVDHWDLLLDKGEKCLDEFAGMMNNPLEKPEGVNCIRHDYCVKTPEGKSNKEWIKFEGEIPPKHPEWGNPNKKILARAEKIDSGSVNIASDTNDFVSFVFHGNKLKGYWVAKRESSRSENWVFSKSPSSEKPREKIEKQQGFGRGRGGQRQSWNSPTFAFIAVWEKEPDHWIPGRTGDPEKEWKRGIMIDEHLDPKVFDELDEIEEISLRASCEGHSKERVAYIVFRFKDKKNDSKAEELVKILNKQEGIYSKTDIGTEKRARIVCAGKTWYGKGSSWTKWWDTLAEKIKDSVDKILKEG